MFRFLRRWRGRHRRLFRFDDGVRIRRVDPLIIAQLLQLHPNYLPEQIDQALAGDMAAQQTLAAAARDVFGVESYNDEAATGLTEAEAIQLIVDFDRYLFGLKKNTSPSSTAPPSTAATSKRSSAPTTSDLWPSGAPVRGPLSGGPIPSG